MARSSGAGPLAGPYQRGAVRVGSERAPCTMTVRGAAPGVGTRTATPRWISESALSSSGLKLAASSQQPEVRVASGSRARSA